MTTGTGILISTLIYVAAQIFFYWRFRIVRRPAAIEARIERIERWLREDVGAEL